MLPRKRNAPEKWFTENRRLATCFVMNHYFYCLYMLIICTPFLFICHIHAYIYMYICMHVCGICDRPQSYSAMYHITFFIYSSLQESSYLLQKKRLYLHDGRTIIKLYLLGERPCTFVLVFSISILLHFVYAFICTIACAYTYIYI